MRPHGSVRCDWSRARRVPEKYSVSLAKGRLQAARSAVLLDRRGEHWICASALTDGWFSSNLEVQIVAEGPFSVTGGCKKATL